MNTTPRSGTIVAKDRHGRLAAWIFAIFLRVVHAQDQFSFMPAGGPDILTGILDTCTACDGIPALSEQDLTAEEWRAYFEQKGVLEDLSEAEVVTLVNYLAINFPSDGVSDASSLPDDGRIMAITNCQLCHSIAIPMTQDRSLERWLEHRRTTPHDSLNLTDVQWDTLAHYLTHNAPLPLEAIPEPLRRGAGGY